MPVTIFSPVRDLQEAGSHFSGCLNGYKTPIYVPLGTERYPENSGPGTTGTIATMIDEG